MGTKIFSKTHYLKKQKKGLLRCRVNRIEHLLHWIGLSPGESKTVVNKKESTPSKQSAEVKQSGDRFQISEFTKDTKEELSKVVWPGRQQLISESAAVILMVSLVAAVIYLVDNFFAWLASRPFLFG